jgi:hypothetical protein
MRSDVHQRSKFTLNPGAQFARQPNGNQCYLKSLKFHQHHSLLPVLPAPY